MAGAGVLAIPSGLRAVAEGMRRSITNTRPLGGGQSTVSMAARVLGALSLLAVGVVHLQQYLKVYSGIPTIGTLFLLNFVGATIVGIGLLAPVERLRGRLGGAVLALLALAGIAQAATAFVFLWISERTPLFGFIEPGYDPEAILAARLAEVATVIFLGAFLVTRFVRRGSAPRTSRRLSPSLPTAQR